MSASAIGAQQLVQVLRQMPMDELRHTMPELEQLLTSVRDSPGAAANAANMSSLSSLLAAGGAGGAAGLSDRAQVATALQQLSRGGVGGVFGSDLDQFRSAAGSTFVSAAPLPPPSSSLPEARRLPHGLGGATGGVTSTAGEEQFGEGPALEAGSGQRPGVCRRKIPLVEGAELDAYAARGPLTILVGRDGQMSHASRGRGNWRRGVAVSSVGRVKFGKGGFGRNAAPQVAPGAAASVPNAAGVSNLAQTGDDDAGADLDGGEMKRKRAKRGEGPRANRIRRDPEVEGFKCCYCPNETTFATSEELKAHKEEMHAGQKQTKAVLPCPVCSLPCKDKHLLAIHMRVHTGERPFQCTKCPAKFRCTSGLNAHLRKHAGLERTFVCFCGESFSSRASVSRHQETAHKMAQPETCEICGVTMPGPITMQSHKRKVHGELVKGATRKKSRCYQCDKCDRTFHREPTLIKHMNVDHAGLQPYSCEQCGETFATAFKYKTHMEQHNPDQLLTRKVCCTLCNARFQNERQLIGHMLSKHPDAEQASSLSLKCKVCEKEFKNYNQLQQHELEHREDWKGFQCKEPECGLFFKTRYLLTKHQILHKGSNLTCQLCDRTFANEASFKSHQKLHERAKEKGEEIKSRGGRPRIGDEGDKSPRKRHRATGRPKGRPRKHPRPEDAEGGEGAGSDGGEACDGGEVGEGEDGEGGDLGEGSADAGKARKARALPLKAAGEVGESDDDDDGKKGKGAARIGKKRKTMEEGTGEGAGEHPCTKCGVLFGNVYDMYEHLRDCSGAPAAGLAAQRKALEAQLAAVKAAEAAALPSSGRAGFNPEGDVSIPKDQPPPPPIPPPDKSVMGRELGVVPPPPPVKDGEKDKDIDATGVEG